MTCGDGRLNMPDMVRGLKMSEATGRSPVRAAAAAASSQRQPVDVSVALTVAQV